MYPLCFLDQFIHYLQRANFLRKNPHEQKSPNELENLMRLVQQLTNQSLYFYLCFSPTTN